MTDYSENNYVDGVGWDELMINDPELSEQAETTYNITEVTKKAKERYEELERKGWDWRSFFNGWLECWAEYYREEQ